MSFTREAVRTEVRNLLRAHAQGGAEVTDSSRLVADLGVDSLGVMELIADIEDKFHLTISDDALREVERVSDVSAAIEKRLEAEGRLDLTGPR
jgi:acyl carrier protein